MTQPLTSSAPLFSFYGDDFTGSTDALEALALGGLNPVLFLAPPTDAQLRLFPNARAIGIAGDSRSRTPSWMDTGLRAAFLRLREIGAPVVQYKVCSTFDSSPETGSIGRALELGLEEFNAPCAPILAAAPRLQRYVVFGHLFAADNGSIHRIDRHPTMSRHPVTPMDESDLLSHLARQTALPLSLVDILALRAGALDRPTEARAVLYDGLEEADLVLVAGHLWNSRSSSAPLFVVASSGFTYGLLDHWRTLGSLPTAPPASRPAPSQRLLVLSGSCSPATGRQIDTALRSGFHSIPLDPALLEWPDARAEALRALSASGRVILHSAHGPSALLESVDRHALAAAMGRLLRDLLAESGVTRAVVAGGDTSSHAVRELGLSALSFAAPLTPGAPLCHAHGWQGPLELVLKGGQVGSDHFFSEVLSCP